MPVTPGKRLIGSLAVRIFDWTRVLAWRRIAKLGSPRTVIDVGVGRGTPELYKAFPNAALVLVDPLPECEPTLKAICAQRPGSQYAVAALGAVEEQRAIQFVPDVPEHSSFLPRTELTAVDSPLESKLVTVTTLDTLMVERALTGPFGLKIDTEGFELDVIRGATAFLQQTQFVIAEVSILKRFEGSYTFAEFIAEMRDRGFEVFDILTVVKPDASGTRYADIAFVRTAAR